MRSSGGGSSTGGGSGGGASSLAIGTGTSSGYGFIASSPTSAIVLDRDKFTTQLINGTTVFIGLKSTSLGAINARVYNSTAPFVGGTTRMVMQFDGEDSDTNSIHDPVTNNSRLTANTSGHYSIFGNVIVSTPASTVIGWESYFIINGATTTYGRTIFAPLISISGTANDQESLNPYTQITLQVNDYVEMVVANLTSTGFIVSTRCVFGMALIPGQSTGGGGGTTSPGGSSTNVQVNNNGAFDGSGSFTKDLATGEILISTNASGVAEGVLTEKTSDNGVIWWTQHTGAANASNQMVWDWLFNGAFGAEIFGDLTITSIGVGIGSSNGQMDFDVKKSGSLTNMLKLRGSDLHAIVPIIDASSTTFNGFNYNWPKVHASGALTDDGSGNLSLVASSGGGVTGSTATITFVFDASSPIGSTRCVSLGYSINFSTWEVQSDSGTFQMHVTTASPSGYKTSGVTTTLTGSGTAPNLTSQFYNAGNTTGWLSTIQTQYDLICGVLDNISNLTWANVSLQGQRQ